MVHRVSPRELHGLRPKPGRLPHQVPLFPGETLTSYVRRTAAANHFDVETTDKAFREQGHFTSHAPNDELRRQTWVEYTGLPEDSFTEPIHLAGEAITERTMCTECTGGEIVRARTPDVGAICLEHSRWIDAPDQTIDPGSDSLPAEETFRNLLVPRGVLHDSLVMRFATTCAAVAHDKDDLTGLSRDDIAKLTYDGSVNLATMLTSSDFLHHVVFLHLTGGNAVEQIQAATCFCLGVDDGGESLPRAVNRIAAVTRKLASRVRSIKIGYPVHGEADELNLFRFIDVWILNQILNIERLESQLIEEIPSFFRE